MRRAARTDASQQAIVDALRKAGCRVAIIREPVDLAVTHRNWAVPIWPVPRHIGTPPSRVILNWRLLEVKTPLKRGKPRKRKDQAAQDAFLAETGTPVVTTPEEALKALGLI